MTLISPRREPKPSEGRSLVARKANAGVLSTPRLARGRSEKLVRSRSTTPIESHPRYLSTDVVSSADAGPSGDSANWGSPVSTVDTYSTVVSHGLASTPSISDVSLASPVVPNRAWRHTRSQSESQFSEVSHTTEEQPNDVLMDLDKPKVSARWYPTRISELLQPDPLRTDIEPQSSTARRLPSFNSAVHARTDTASLKRTPQPLLPWPAGRPRLVNPTTADGHEVLPGRKKGKGIKTPYKNEEEKAKVKAVRDSGACMRCVIFRQACEVLAKGQTCEACNVVRRKWYIPCTKIWLRDRCWCLVPATFFDHLQLYNDVAFPQQLYAQANRSEHFFLKLTKEFGLQFEIEVFAVRGMAHDRNMFIKLTWEAKEGGLVGSYKEVPRLTLPLVPVLSSTAVETVRNAVRETMQKLSREPRHLSDIIFPDHEGQDWVREVFELVCRFQEDVLQGQSTALDLALKAIFIRCLMARTFDISPEEIPWINEQLPEEHKLHPDDLEILTRGDLAICAKLPDRFVKAALLRVLKTSLLPRCFSEFEDLFCLTEKDHGKSRLSELSRDEVFCTTVVILVLAGMSQIKIMHAVRGRLEFNWNGVNDTADGPGKLYREGRDNILEIERELIDHVLHLWSYQFKKEKMVGEVKPHEERAAKSASTYNVLGMFRDSVIAHGDTIGRIPLDLQLEMHLDQNNLDVFFDQNLTRILLRLNSVLWKPKTRQR